MGEAESGHVYDEVKLGSDPGHKFCSGEKLYVDDLVAKFPDEREGIEEYVRLCKKANKAADLYFFAKLFAKPIQWLVKVRVLPLATRHSRSPPATRRTRCSR